MQWGIAENQQYVEGKPNLEVHHFKLRIERKDL
jgi:hypothetical protein